MNEFNSNCFYLRVHLLTVSLFFQTTASVTAASASVTLAGKGRTVTALRVRTRACPASVCCAAAAGTASAEFVSALNLVPTAPPVRNVPPVLIPAPSKCKFRV